MQLTALDDNLIDLLPAAVYVCEAPSGVIRRYNRRAAELWGREPIPGAEDERFCGAFRILLPGGAPLPHEEAPGAEVLRTGVGVRNVEAVLERPDGSRVSVLVNIEPLRGADGALIGSVTVFQDITERKQAEEAAKRLAEERSARAAAEEAERRTREQAQTLAAILAASADPIYVLDCEGRLTHASPSAARVLGKKVSEATGKTWQELGLDASAMEGVDRARRLVRATGRPYRGELSYPAPDGARLFEYVLAPIQDGDGAPGSVVGVARDVTEQREAEAALRYMAANARCVLWHAEVAERGGRYPHWSTYLADEEAAQRFLPLDVPPDSTYLRTWYHSVLPEDRERRDEQANRAVRAGESYRCVFRTRQKDGTVRWLQEDVVVRTAGPKQWRAVGICADITDRRRVEDALRESETRLRFALTAGHVGCWDWDIREGRVVWSENLEALHGLPEGNFPGTFEGFLALVHPEDRERVTEAIRSAVELGEEYDLELRTLRPDGGVLWIATRAQILRDEAGSSKRMIGISRDVTAQKRAEETLRFFDSASQVLQSSLDRSTTLRSLARLCVPRLADYCSLYEDGADRVIRQVAEAHVDPAKEPLLHRLREIYTPDPLNPHSHVARAVRSGEGKLLNGLTIPDPRDVTEDTEVLEIHRRLAPVSAMVLPLIARDRVLGAISFVAAESGRQYSADDYSVAEGLARRAALAMDNARLYGALQEADRRKDEFLAMLSHELRNPLAPILNAAQVLQLRGGLDAGQERQREIIERQSRHLARLVDDLLEVSRITQGKVALRMEDADLHLVVQQAVQAVLPYVEGRRHRLQVRHGSAQAPVLADPTRLMQVFANLLTNAARYTDPGGEIDVSVTVEDRDDERCGPDLPHTADRFAVVKVRDTGRGIREDLLPHVFDLFVQDDRAPARTEGGLGIGLTLVKQLVEMHGGSVAARSQGSGRGSEFEVRLPLSTGASAGGTGAPSAAGPQAALQPSRCRVLVVEDNRDAAETLLDLLALWEFPAAAAGSGPEALELAGALRPEVVLLDIGLPGMDGYEVARRLRSDPALADADLIALTGYGDETHQRRSAEAGFRHHLTKPVDPEALHAVLRSL